MAPTSTQVAPPKRQGAPGLKVDQCVAMLTSVHWQLQSDVQAWRTQLMSVVAPCRSWTLSPDMTALLDNKARFSDYAASLGLAVPQHHVVSSPAQLRAINDPKVHVRMTRQGLQSVGVQ